MNSCFPVLPGVKQYAVNLTPLINGLDKDQEAMLAKQATRLIPAVSSARNTSLALIARAK